MAGWRSRVKDGLTSVGLLEVAKQALWTFRYHRDRLTGTFVMEAVPVRGLAPGPHAVDIHLGAIAHLSRLFVWERYYRTAFVYSGNWDEKIKHRRLPFEQVPAPGEGDLGAYAHRTVVDLFEHGIAYRETAEYRHLAERIRRGGTPRGCRTRDDLDAHFQQLFADDDAISRGVFGRVGTDGHVVPFPVHAFVDRHGGMIHYSQGLHQLRMAERHGLKRVPVRLLAVHARWALPLLAERSDEEPMVVLHNAASALVADERSA